jgi:sirohydrochlorin cobaltochelatase
MTAQAGRTGVLLFAHGARDPDWARPFEQVVHELRALRPGIEVQLAFLEFMSPPLSGAADALAEAGCTRIDVVPLFLGAGGHVRKDVPHLFARLREAHPNVRFTLHPAVGERPEVISSMAGAAASLVEHNPDS